MATPSTDCYCGMDKLDILKLIYQRQVDIFNRLQQLIQALS